jgi:hypothetical protein
VSGDLSSPFFNKHLLLVPIEISEKDFEYWANIHKVICIHNQLPGVFTVGESKFPGVFTTVELRLPSVFMP